jgi:tRNA 2-selenouridine synthase SelU
MFEQDAGLANLAGQEGCPAAQFVRSGASRGEVIAQPLQITLRFAEQRDAFVGIACARMGQ